jgi:hypothetical protein
MSCQQCASLSRELKARDRELTMAVSCLAAVDAAEDSVLFMRFRVRLSEARMEHELARLMLEKHQQDGHAA